MTSVATMSSSNNVEDNNEDNGPLRVTSARDRLSTVLNGLLCIINKVARDSHPVNLITNTSINESMECHNRSLDRELTIQPLKRSILDI